MRPVHLGPADLVTGVRALLTLVVAVLVAGPLLGVGAATPRTAVVVLGTLALLLDGVDGAVARRTGTVTPFGARFDMETDAALVLVLSVLAASDLGLWVLLIGLARYLLLVAQRLVARLRSPLRPRYWRKVVAVAQGVALLVTVSGRVDPVLSAALLAAALAALGVSFGTEAVERLGWRPGVRRPWLGALGSGAAVVVVWAALVAPAALGVAGGRVAWSWGAAGLPVEGLLLVLLAVLLPWRAGRAVAAGAGLVAGSLLVLTALDVAFPLVLDRPFDLLGDWGYLVSAVGVLAASEGAGAAGALLTGAALALLGVVALVVGAALRLARDAHRVRRGATPFVVGLTSIALVSGGVATGPGRSWRMVTAPTATAVADRSEALLSALGDPARFGRALAADPWEGRPTTGLLAGLEGHDVVVVFVESYGRIALQDSTIEPEIDRELAGGTSQLAASGWSARSAYLTSPTFGGGSWLAHSTLESGAWVDSQRRYDQLTRTGHLTLASAFHRAGWRTVIASPATTRDWPEARSFYGVDALYDARTSGYAGPTFGYAPAPDQYTLAHLSRTELTPGPRTPVMAEVDLVTSHHPWSPVPQLVPWADVGDGSVFATQDTSTHDVLTDPASARRAYADSLRYSLRTLTSWLGTVVDDGLVVVLVGDHQPHHLVSGPDPGRDVPVSVLARDPAALRALDGWGWPHALRPPDDAPVERMDALRDRILRTFSQPPAAPPPPASGPAR
ncbi:CDP-alcohol phosphatidyltransferase family protein [Phycicoccus avicenniae]|uniref:CDP-alcohol phosphatidyltransferase family protein n=1 Tax=Phycicoccus avicenniae TaxID=2828860 RepID=UPI003D2DC8D9